MQRRGGYVPNLKFGAGVSITQHCENGIMLHVHGSRDNINDATPDSTAKSVGGGAAAGMHHGSSTDDGFPAGRGGWRGGGGGQLAQGAANLVCGTPLQLAQLVERPCSLGISHRHGTAEARSGGSASDDKRPRKPFWRSRRASSATA